MDKPVRLMVYMVGVLLIGGLLNVIIKDKIKDSYINRAEIANALSIASMIKSKIEMYYADSGELPYSNYGLGLSEPESFSGNGLKKIIIEELGVIHVVMGGEDEADDGHIFLIPQKFDSLSRDRWLCLTPNYRTISEFAPQCKYQPVEGW